MIQEEGQHDRGEVELAMRLNAKTPRNWCLRRRDVCSTADKRFAAVPLLGQDHIDDVPKRVADRIMRDALVAIIYMYIHT